jgi:hypothetical protein
MEFAGERIRPPIGEWISEWRSQMRMVRIGGIVALALGVTGCPVEQVPETDTIVTDTPTVAPPTMGPNAQPGEAQPVTFSLGPVGGTGVGGEARIAPREGRTEITIQLTGAGPGQKNGHIHSGTCDAKGPPVADLPPVTPAADGTGTARTTLDLAPATVMDGRHVVAYHQADGGADSPHVVCGEIPARI